MDNMPPLPISSINAFSEALYGKKGALDAWLEVNNEDEVRAHMKAYVDAHARVYAEQRVRPLVEALDAIVTELMDGDDFSAAQIARHAGRAALDAEQEKQHG